VLQDRRLANTGHGKSSFVCFKKTPLFDTTGVVTDAQPGEVIGSKIVMHGYAHGANGQAAGYTCKVWSGDSDADIDAAAAALSRGEPVGFPTETVYGLGALSSEDAAVTKIFKAKGRPSDNPLIVHFADGHAGLRLLAADGQVPPEATALANAFWPGPLSICIRANTHAVSHTCRAGLDTVALRVPNHPVALKLLQALDAKMGKATGVYDQSFRNNRTSTHNIAYM